MRIAVIGLGYVGLANLAVLSGQKSVDVVGFDHDLAKVSALNNRTFSFDEEDLKEELAKNKPLITSDPSLAFKGTTAFVISVGTPALRDGSTDLASFYEVLALIKRFARSAAFVVIRSTVPVGTAKSAASFLNKGCPYRIKVISFPEFLAEGTSFLDEKKPTRLVVGALDNESFGFIRSLKRAEIKAGVPLFEMSNESAELAKYASNAFLATKICFINEIARLAEKDGADILDVALAMGADPRIGKGALKPGIGYGGSCFSKDVASLLAQASALKAPLLLPEAAAAINLTQPLYFLKKIKKRNPELNNAKIAFVGLAYKARISDIRNSLSLVLASYLLAEGASVVAFDSSLKAREDFKERLPKVKTADSLDNALVDADLLVILNEDPSSVALDEHKLAKLMKGHAIYDAKDLYPLGYFKLFDYYSLGRKDVINSK